MFVFAAIFSFAFFDKAGSAGRGLFEAGDFLLGKGVFLVPLFFVTAGLLFWGMKRYSGALVFLTLLLLVSGASGILGGIARWKEVNVAEVSGWIGFVVSWPLFTFFGFWVAEIVFGAVIVIAGIIFWHLLPRERIENSVIPQAAQEKIKKILEPKFEVQEVDPEPKVQPAGAPDTATEEKKGRRLPSFRAKPIDEGAYLGNYKIPPTELLEAEKGVPSAGDIKTFSAIIKKTLQNFDIPVEISEVNIGPTVTQYAFKPAEGVKLSRITALQNDLALALAAHPLRIEAPIPGRALVGVEIPNKVRATVRLRSLLENPQFKNSGAPLLLALGKDVSGSPAYADLARMPHFLVAGATGTGKTIGLNNIILSLIYRNSPARLRLILVDPKRVEFPVYNDLSHLLTPVIFDTQRTINALKWLIKEMERRFQVLSETRVRDIASYHALAAESRNGKNGSAADAAFEEMPYIVMVIDELADLIAARGKEMEGMIVRLAQMARAIGIHLVLATQRPSVEVITGLIKANITARIAFQVASQVDSRTILDSAGAEKLLGQGDMLYVSAEFTKPRRLQGAYVSDKEVKKVIEWIAKETGEVLRENFEADGLGQSALVGLEGDEDGGDDPLYEQARRVVAESRKASASLLQRRLKIGYARAARLLDILEEKGVVGPGDGAKPREVYIGAPDGFGDQETKGEEDEERSPWVSP